MINVKQLRPLNQVKNNGRIERVTTIFFDPKGEQFCELQLTYKAVFIGDIEPIVINEEHLLQIAGPDTSMQQSEHTKVFNFSCGPFDRIILKMDGSVKLMNVNLHQVEVVYWHDLQNIYFALTGAEIYLKDYWPFT